MKLFCREEIGGEGKKKKSRAAAVWTEKEMTTIPLCLVIFKKEYLYKKLRKISV